MTSTDHDDFGIKHSNFRFRFATKSSNEQDELAERACDKETATLKLSGFPGNDGTFNGWKVQPLHIPALVS